MDLISSCQSITKIPEKVSICLMANRWPLYMAHFFLAYLNFSKSLANNLIEYDDDTTIIPRSTSVTARRLPAARPGKGGAARYVSGKMPINARGASRNEQAVPNQSHPSASHTVNSSVLELNNAQTEEEKINALFNLQANQWKEQQQEMAK